MTSPTENKSWLSSLYDDAKDSLVSTYDEYAPKIGLPNSEEVSQTADEYTNIANQYVDEATKALEKEFPTTAAIVKFYDKHSLDDIKKDPTKAAQDLAAAIVDSNIEAHKDTAQAAAALYEGAKKLLPEDTQQGVAELEDAAKKVLAEHAEDIATVAKAVMGEEAGDQLVASLSQYLAPTTADPQQTTLAAIPEIIPNAQETKTAIATATTTNARTAAPAPSPEVAATEVAPQQGSTGSTPTTELTGTSSIFNLPTSIWYSNSYEPGSTETEITDTGSVANLMASTTVGATSSTSSTTRTTSVTQQSSSEPATATTTNTLLATTSGSTANTTSTGTTVTSSDVSGNFLTTDKASETTSNSSILVANAGTELVQGGAHQNLEGSVESSTNTGQTSSLSAQGEAKLTSVATNGTDGQHQQAQGTSTENASALTDNSSHETDTGSDSTVLNINNTGPNSVAEQSVSASIVTTAQNNGNIVPSAANPVILPAQAFASGVMAGNNGNLVSESKTSREVAASLDKPLNGVSDRGSQGEGGMGQEGRDSTTEQIAAAAFELAQDEEIIPEDIDLSDSDYYPSQTSANVFVA